MIILGIDPGTTRCGYGVVELDKGVRSALDWGTIDVKGETSDGKRLSSIRKKILSLISQWKPEHVAVEALFFAKNAKTVMKVAEARGVILEALESVGVQVQEYKPNEVKLYICGWGGAKKPQIQKAVQMHLRLQSLPKPDDAADALALAIIHSHAMGRGAR